MKYELLSLPVTTMQVSEGDDTMESRDRGRLCEPGVQQQVTGADATALTIRFVTLSVGTVFSINASWTTGDRALKYMLFLFCHTVHIGFF